MKNKSLKQRILDKQSKRGANIEKPYVRQVGEAFKNMTPEQQDALIQLAFMRNALSSMYRLEAKAGNPLNEFTDEQINDETYRHFSHLNTRDEVQIAWDTIRDVLINNQMIIKTHDNFYQLSEKGRREGRLTAIGQGYK